MMHSLSQPSPIRQIPMPHLRSKLPPRTKPFERGPVFAGAVSLAGLAGYINVVVLGFFNVPVSHMSGAVSRLSIDLTTSNHTDLIVVDSIIGGFLVGAVVSGIVIGGQKLLPGRRYGVALLMEGGVLAVAVGLLRAGNPFGVALAAMACGIQNGMGSSYYGLDIRTTHVTGTVTDLGVMMGHWIRHRRVPPWKMVLLLGIVTGFFTGGLTGALAFRRFGVTALAFASAGSLAAGATYFAWLQTRTART
jgi:uncharacterized membrane protein YoaK (UPF0700 family)